MTCKRKMGLVGTKLGMTKVFADDGSYIPVTVIDVSENFVVQVKSPEHDGYSAIQVGVSTKKNRSRVNKAILGHYARSGVAPCACLKEFPVDQESLAAYEPGQLLPASLFEAGQKVDVRGLSIGKGFAGAIKRHNFSSNRASHGNSVSHRKPGSTGMAQDPGRVFPGKRMAGHMGHEQVAIQNLLVVRVCTERNLLWLKGAVPGHKGARLVVMPAVKVAA